jgi:hypothetical protein
MTSREVIARGLVGQLVDGWVWCRGRFSAACYDPAAA